MTYRGHPNGPVTVTANEPVRVDFGTDGDYAVGTQTFSADYGATYLVKADGALHYGGAGVANTGANRGALLDAGERVFFVTSKNPLWVIAPVGGSVAMEVLAYGVNAS